MSLILFLYYAENKTILLFFSKNIKRTSEKLSNIQCCRVAYSEKSGIFQKSNMSDTPLKHQKTSSFYVFREYWRRPVTWSNILANIYLFKFNNRETRKKSEMYSKLTIKTPDRRQWRLSGVFIVNFEHISHSIFSVSIVDFVQINFRWYGWQ